MEQKTKEAAKLKSFAHQTPSYHVLLMTTIISATAFAISMLIIIAVALKNRRRSRKYVENTKSVNKSAAELQQQMAVVAAATAAATAANHSVHSSAYVSSKPGYCNNACESDPEYYDNRTLRKGHSKISVRSNHSNSSKKRNHYRRHSVHHCDSNCYSSDDTYTESEEDIKCSVVWCILFYCSLKRLMNVFYENFKILKNIYIESRGHSQNWWDNSYQRVGIRICYYYNFIYFDFMKTIFFNESGIIYEI